MKKNLIIVLSIFLLHCKEPSKPITRQINNGDSYNCILKERVTGYVGCGIYLVVVAMRFQIEDEKGNLVVLIPCPESYGEIFFSKGKKYRIQLTSDAANYKDHLVSNQYSKLHLPTFYAMHIAKND